MLMLRRRVKVCVNEVDAFYEFFLILFCDFCYLCTFVCVMAYTQFGKGVAMRKKFFYKCGVYYKYTC
jgi:hypothetical protein